MERSLTRFEEFKEREFKAFVPNYLSVLIPKRLLVGEFPAQRNDIRYLVERLGVSHIVNLKPETVQTTAKGFNKASWYTCHFEPLKVGPHLVRMPLENEYDAAKLISLAKQVVELLKSESEACIFIHRTSGMCEEALIGLLAWSIFDQKSFPKDISAWMKEKQLERLLSKMEEGETLLKECIEKSRTNTMGNYFKKLKQ